MTGLSEELKKDAGRILYDAQARIWRSAAETACGPRGRPEISAEQKQNAAAGAACRMRGGQEGKTASCPIFFCGFSGAALCEFQ